jgi:hypothetical protein
MKRDAIFSKSLRPRGPGPLASELNRETPSPSGFASESTTAKKRYLDINKIKKDYKSQSQ